MRREGAAGASSPALMGATPLDAHHRVGSLNASSEWLHKLDAKRSCRKMARRALPMLMALWALILLGLTFTDYGAPLFPLDPAFSHILPSPNVNGRTSACARVYHLTLVFLCRLDTPAA